MCGGGIKWRVKSSLAPLSSRNPPPERGAWTKRDPSHPARFWSTRLQCMSRSRRWGEKLLFTAPTLKSGDKCTACALLEAFVSIPSATKNRNAAASPAVATCLLPVKFTCMHSCNSSTGRGFWRKEKRELKHLPGPDWTTPTLRWVYVPETLELIRGASSHDDREAADTHAEVCLIWKQGLLLSSCCSPLVISKALKGMDGTYRRGRRRRRRRGKAEEGAVCWAAVDHLEQWWAPHLLLHCSRARQRRELHVAPTDRCKTRTWSFPIGWIQDSAAPHAPLSISMHAHAVSLFSLHFCFYAFASPSSSSPLKTVSSEVKYCNANSSAQRPHAGRSPRAVSHKMSGFLKPQPTHPAWIKTKHVSQVSCAVQWES